MTAKYERTCGRCEREFTAAKATARYCSENCRKRACDDRRRASCAECGRPLSAGSANHYDRPFKLCTDCSATARRAKMAARDRQFEEWWAAGLTLQDIADRMGWSREHVGMEFDRARTRGADLPYRRPNVKLKFPEQLVA